MLEVAVTRLSALWPSATVEILTDTPELLPVCSPNVRSLSAAGRRRWLEDGYLSLDLLPGSRPKQLGSQTMERYLRHWRPEMVGNIKRKRARLTGRQDDHLDSFLAAVQAADIVVVAGMGGITDVFEDYAFQLLDTLHLAQRLGKTTAMFGQGMGPIHNPKLQARAREVLRGVNLIALREDRAGGPLLDSLGVSRDRVLTTGDDAIEKAFDQHTDLLGDGLGINVRSSTYSGIDPSFLEPLGSTLIHAARACGVPIVAVPTSRHPSEKDGSTLRQLFHGTDSLADYGESLDTPRKVIQRIQRCRVVVTASYHAAVFALSQGTPVICLENSAYYADKFRGLAAQFGGGVEVISLKEQQLGATLRDSILRAWESAEGLRPLLLASAKKQIDLGRAAYQRLHDMVCQKGEIAGVVSGAGRVSSKDNLPDDAPVTRS